MKRKYLSRAAVCALALLMVLIPVFVVSADAAGSYSILSADFDIALAENGSATVRETWIVEYKSGDFSRFYKEIHKADLADYEEYTQAEMHDFLINDVWLDYTDDHSGRPSNTWSFVEDDDDIELNWYLKVQAPTQVRYNCEYVLKNVVHELADGNAIFAYRVVGAKFDKAIDATTVKIHLPGASTHLKNYSFAAAEETTEDSISFRMGSHSGLQKYIIAMDRSLFGSLLSSTASEANFTEKVKSNEETQKTSDTVFDVFAPIVGFLVGVLLYGGIFYWIHRIRKKGKQRKAEQQELERRKLEAFLQKLEDDPEYMTEVMQKLKDAGVSPLALACTLNKRSHNGSVFLIGMLCQMVNDGWASISDDTIEIVNRVYQDTIVRDFVNLMVTVFPYTEADRYLCFDTAQIADRLQNLDKNNNLFKVLDQMADKMMKLPPAAVKNEYQTVQDYFKYVSFSSDVNNVLQLAKENGEVDPLLLAGLFQGATANCGTNEPLEKLAFLGVFIRDARTPMKSNGSSDSGCGGCSGCSGCSGCGGGGAD